MHHTRCVSMADACNAYRIRRISDASPLWIIHQHSLVALVSRHLDNSLRPTPLTPTLSPPHLLRTAPGEGTGCKVLEKKSLPELRGTVLQEHPIDGPSDADGAPDGTAAAADGADDGATDGSDAEPVFADGTRALETLSFDHSWFEENLYGLREAMRSLG